ncbi:hypothetical protein ABT263_35890 [Kitasatospora sp. NPDC001603]|uniref:hypothetical protein n=1 Tax=Kitasatospora sp. NPDC001603 TaxID=3154388 RepID=UPI003332FDF4
MSRYTMPLTDSLRLEWGYDRPLHNVFAQLWKNDSIEPVEALGLYSFIVTVAELMPALDAMLAPYPGAALSEEDRDNIRTQLIADGADPGDSDAPASGAWTRPRDAASPGNVRPSRLPAGAGRRCLATTPCPVRGAG